MSTHGHHQMVNTEIILIMLFVAEDGEALFSQQKQDLELTVTQIIAKFRLKLKKVGKTTRSFRCGLNETLYDDTVVVTNRLKELVLVDSACGQGFITLHRRQ